MKTQNVVSIAKFIVWVCAVLLLHTPVLISQPLPSIPLATFQDPSGIEGIRNFVVFSPDGSKVLTGGQETAILWNAQTGEQLLTFEGHIPFAGAVVSGAFSPDGKLAITGGNSLTAFIWNVETGEVVQTIRLIEPLLPSTIAEVDFSPDGKKVIIADTGSFTINGNDGLPKVRIFDVATGREVVVLDVRRNNGTGPAKFISNEEVFVSTSSGSAIVSAISGELIKQFPEGIISNDFQKRITFHRTFSNGNRVSTEFFEIWDINTSEKIGGSGPIETTGSKIAISANGNFMVIGKSNKNDSGIPINTLLLDIRNPSSLSVARMFIPSHAPEAEVRDAVFSPDGKKLAILFEGTPNFVNIYDISDLTTGIPNAAVFDN